MGEYRRAIEDYATTVSLDPSDLLSWYNGGLARLEIEDYQDAAEQFGEVVRRDPTDALAHYQRARANAALGDADEAFADVERAMDAGGRRWVVAVQRMLVDRGYDPGRTDGTYDDATRDALLACLEANCPGDR